MFAVQFRDQLFNIQLFAEAGVQFIEADLELGSKLRQRSDAIQHLASDQLLRRFRKFRSFSNRQLKGPRHGLNLTDCDDGGHLGACAAEPAAGPGLAKPLLAASDHILDVKRLSETRVEFINADLELCTK
jgi:hypothetical protein